MSDTGNGDGPYAHIGLTPGLGPGVKVTSERGQELINKQYRYVLLLTPTNSRILQRSSWMIEPDRSSSYACIDILTG